MRIALLSDIHGNFEALEAVLADAKQRGYDRLYCLGDLVGYGADPDLCIERIREVVWSDSQGEAVVRGNHDDAVVSRIDKDFNADARRAVRWTVEHLSDTSRDWLDHLPLTCEYEECFQVHSSPYQPSKWNYVTSLSDAQDAFPCFTQKVAFIGHSHIPFTVGADQGLYPIRADMEEEVIFQPQHRYLTNVGSVGQPRDGNPKSCYVIFDSDRGRIQRFRVSYPIEETVRKIHASKLPAFLADRLLIGR
jgi:diadenosine tetraphosphatase ApaH/serine/threonine PP2A family protein phosphatase